MGCCACADSRELGDQPSSSQVNAFVSAIVDQLMVCDKTVLLDTEAVSL